MIHRHQICVLCFGLGVLAASVMLVAGGILGFVPGTHPLIDRASAYLVAVSLLLLAGSYVLQRFVVARD